MSLRDQPARVGLAVALVFAVLFLTGCLGGGGSENKAGGKSERTITLTMQTPDSEDPDAKFFIRQVQQRTGDRIRIVVGTQYPSTDAANETRLVRDLRRGTVAMAYIAARDWETGGVSSFRALQAPFLITNYALQRRVATGPIGVEMLRGLAQTGLVGLGLVPSELRRPLGRRPLLSAADYRGARLRVMTSPTSALDLRTLGAISVTKLTSDEVGAALGKGQLDGVETSTRFIESNDYTHYARYLPSNLALFAKLQTIVIGGRVFERLDHSERAALRAAAEATARHADPAAGERKEAKRLCGQGLRLVTATQADISSLRLATARAYALLERDPLTKKEIVEIVRLKQSVPAVASSLPACQHRPGASGQAKTPFPEGAFVTTITHEDLVRAGLTYLPDGTGTATLTLGNGTFRIVISQHPKQVDASGRLTVHGNQVAFDPPRGDVLKWSYFRGLLTFRIASVPDAAARLMWTAHPWREVK